MVFWDVFGALVLFTIVIVARFSMVFLCFLRFFEGLVVSLELIVELVFSLFLFYFFFFRGDFGDFPLGTHLWLSFLVVFLGFWFW